MAQFQQQQLQQQALLQNEFQQQQQTLQNEFRGLADAQRETDRRLNDVITGGAGGTGGMPPAPFAPAAVLPVPPVATVNVQPQLHPLRQFRMTDGVKHFLGGEWTGIDTPNTSMQI